MGSSFYSFNEAASRLKRSKRSLHNYIKKGLLRREFINGEAVLNREDVDQLAEDSGVDLPAMNRRSFLAMAARLKKVENQMITVMHILQLRDDRIHPTPEQAEQFYRAAGDCLSRSSKWSKAEVDLWAKQIERMDETFLEVVCKVTHNSSAWTPFLRIATEMMQYAYDQNEKKVDIEWQALHKKLHEGRSTLRAAIVIWVEMDRGSSVGSVLDLVDDPKKALLKDLMPPNGKRV